MNKHIKGAQRNAILNHNEIPIPLHTYQNSKFLSLTILSIRGGKDVSYAVDGSLNWANLLEKLALPQKAEVMHALQSRDSTRDTT